jgi:AraC-like DNA-binding protein
MTSRTVPATFVRTALAAAAERGLDLGPVATACGIGPELLADPRARFTPEQVSGFLRGMWRLSADELFGLGRGPVPRGTFRLVCYAVISSPDLREVCRRLEQFGPVLPSAPQFSLVEAGGVAQFVADLDGMADPGHLLSDFTLVLLHRFTGWLAGTRIPLRAVELPYPPPANPGEYDLIFGAPLRFGARHPALELDAGLLSLPVVRDQPDLDRYLEHSPADLLARRDYGTTLAEQVRRLLERGLVADWPTSDEVARRLSVSPQHLRRRLREEGTSLGTIRNDLLRDTAIARLTRGEPVDAIATRLGFSEASAFRRAFRRWTGTTPSAYQPNRRSA